MLDVQWVREQERDYPGIIRGVTPRFLEEAGIIVKAQAKDLAPYKTGNLKGSITHQTFADRVEVGTNVEYAEHQEYGTRHMKAQPFMRPAIDLNRRNLLKRLAELIRARINFG